MKTLEIVTSAGLITSAYPATLSEYGWSRAEREGRPWYLVKRPSVDDVGVTPELKEEDEIINTYEFLISEVIPEVIP